MEIYDFISDEQRKVLGSVLDSKADDETVKRILQAAFTEYIQMMLGEKVFTRGSDIREYRLLLLIKTLYRGNIPSEQQVSDLFQTTTSESKSLLRAVFAKYKNELKEILNSTMILYLENVDKITSFEMRESKYIYITDLAREVSEEMNRILSKQAGDIELLIKKRNTANTYFMPYTSYNKLCDHLNIDAKSRVEWKENE